MIRSPLRYPGGKSYRVKQLMEYMPEFTEYREPFVGGGSVFFYLKQRYPDRDYWINDSFYPLSNFYLQLQRSASFIAKDLSLFEESESLLKKSKMANKRLYEHNGVGRNERYS